MAKRPEHSKEPAFQVMAAAVHLFSALFHIGAFVYHVRRTRNENDDA